MDKFLSFGIIAGVIAAAIVAGVFISFSQPAASSQPQVLRMGLIPAEDQAEMLRKFEPTVKYLEESTGMKVEPFVATDYTGIVEAMKNDKLDVALLGPFSYVIAASQDDSIVPFAVGERADTGKTTYQSIIVAHKDSGVRSIEDLKNKKSEVTFAFVDPASTSGHLIPKGYLLSQGIDPEKDFKSVTFAGGHDTVELAIKSGTVKLGADADVTYDALVSKGTIDPDTNMVIWKSDPIPGSPLVIRNDLPEDTKEKIISAFLNMHKAKNANEVLGGYGSISQYVPASEKDYKPVFDAAINLNMIQKRN